MIRLSILILLFVMAMPVAWGQSAWHAGSINALVWSPDGTQLASGNADGTVQIWDAASGTVVQALNGHTGSVVSVAWRGDQVASGGLDNRVMVWQMPSGNPLQTITDHSDDVWSVVWSPDAQWLASVSGSGELGLWGAGSRLIQGAHSSAIYALAWNPNGTQLATGAYDGLIRLWGVDGTSLSSWESQIGQINVLGWGKGLVVAGEAAQIEIWVGEQALYIPHPAAVYSLSFHPDGERFVVGDRDGQISLYTVGGEWLDSWNGHTSVVTALSFSPDGTRLASGSSDQQIRLWAID